MEYTDLWSLTTTSARHTNFGSVNNFDYDEVHDQMDDLENLENLIIYCNANPMLLIKAISDGSRFHTDHIPFLSPGIFTYMIVVFFADGMSSGDNILEIDGENDFFFDNLTIDGDGLDVVGFSIDDASNLTIQNSEVKKLQNRNYVWS